MISIRSTIGTKKQARRISLGSYHHPYGSSKRTWSLLWLVFPFVIGAVHILLLFLQRSERRSLKLRMQNNNLPPPLTEEFNKELFKLEEEEEEAHKGSSSLSSSSSSLLELLPHPADSSGGVDQVSIQNKVALSATETNGAESSTFVTTSSDESKQNLQVAFKQLRAEADQQQQGKNVEEEDRPRNQDEEHGAKEHQHKLEKAGSNEEEAEQGGDTRINAAGREEQKLDSPTKDIIRGKKRPSSQVTTSDSDSDGRLENMKQYNDTVFSLPEEIPSNLVSKLDAILVIGGGGATASGYEPSAAAQRSVDDVIGLLSINNNTLGTANLPILCLSTQPPPERYPLSQGAISASYLLTQGRTIGLDPDRVYMESSSLDLMGGAFYSRQNYADMMGWRNLMIVVNQVRQSYTQAVFHWIYGLDSEGGPYNLVFLVQPDIVVETPPADVGTTGAEKVSHIHKLSPLLRTMSDVHHFLHHEHKLYSAKYINDRLDSSAFRS